MSFSQGTASHVVPLVARLVLAAAFIPAGWSKLTDTAYFTPEEATTLRSLSVSVTDTATPEASSIHRVVLRQRDGSVNFGVTVGSATELFEELARSVQDPDRRSDDTADAIDDATGEVAAPPIVQPDRRPIAPPPVDEGDRFDDAADDAGDDDDAQAAPVPPATPTGGGTAMALHRVTLMVHAQGWPLPVVQGWAAMAVELLGGSLLLIGLFSRLWGLGLAVTMGVAFYLTSWPILQDTSLFELAIPDYNRLFAQVGLFALAFGVLLTGPGAVSLDRLLFRPAGAELDPPPA